MEKQKETLSAHSGGRAKSILYNSLLLCASAIVVRAVGVYFSIYIATRVGAEGMGLYSLSANVWGFAMTLALSGINLAATRCVAEAGDHGGEIKAAMRRAITYAIGFGTLASLLLLFLSKPIAIFWLKEERIILSLRLFAISLPAISVCSALNGYFSAVRRAWKSAGVGLIEQAAKIYATAALLTRLLPRGAEYACAAVVLGGALSELISCGISFALYLFDRKKLSREIITQDKAKKLTRRLFGIAMPVAFSTYVRSGLTTLEHTLIPTGLITFGMSRSEALAEYGIISAMVLPLVMFPYAFINSFTGLLVPEIAGAASLSHKKRISYIALRSWRLTILFGLATAGIMAVCSSSFGIRIYGNAKAAQYILAVAPLLPVMYLDTVTDSMLKGLGDQVYTMRVNIADAAISVILVRILVPHFGILGYIAVLYISELINFSLSASRLISRTGITFLPFRWCILPLACLVISSRVCCSLFHYIPLYSIPTWGSITLQGAFVVAIFVLLSLITGAIDKELTSWVRSTVFKKKKEGESNAKCI